MVSPEDAESPAGWESDEPRSQSESENPPEEQQSSGFGRSLLRETATYSAGVAGAALIGFVAVPVYTRVIGPTGYGDVALALAIVAPLSAIANLGLDVALSRHWFDSGRDREDVATSLLAFAGMWSALLTVLGAVLIAAAATLDVLPPVLPPLLLITLAALLPTQLFTHALQLLRNEFRPTAYVIVSLVAALTGTSVGVALVVTGVLGAPGPLVGVVVTGVAGCALALPLTRRFLCGRVTWAAFAPLLRLGAPLVPASLAFWVFSGFDRIVIGALAPWELPGYSVAAQIVLPLGLVVTAIGQAWVPRIVQRHATDPEYAGRAIVLGTELVLAGFAVIAAVAGLLAPQLIGIIAGPGYESGIAPLPLLATATVMLGTSVLTATGSLLALKTARTPLITIAAAVIDVAALLWLVPRWGGVGAGVALLMAYSLMLWLTLAYSQSVFRLPFRLLRLVILWFGVVVQAVLAAVAPGSPQAWLAAAWPVAWCVWVAVSLRRDAASH